MTTQELQTVLAISRTIATIREKSELLKLIIEQLQPLFNCYDCGLFVFNKDKTTLEDLTVSLPSISPSAGNQLLADDDAAFIPYQGSVFEWVFDRFRAANAPFIHTYKEDQVPDWVNYVQASVIDTIGYEESMVAVLRIGGDEIGVFMVNSLQKGTFQKDQYVLYQAIADQVAVAVANILANEEILKREREKSQLLEISQAIATVQNHKQLLKVIYEKIKPIFPYDNAGLFVFDKTGEWFQEILDTDVLSDAVQTELTATLDLGPFPIAGHHPKAWHYAQTPVIYSLAEQAQYYGSLNISHQFEVGLRHGLQQMIGGPLICGGRKIGLISFNSKDSNFYTQQNIPLFQAIADQVAVAVANILANQEILEREREKGVLLSISENIASVRDKVDLLKVIIEKIKPLFGFYDCGILVIDRENRFHDLAVVHPQIDDSEVNHELNKQGFYHDSGLDYANSGLEWIINQIEKTQSPVLFDYTTEHVSFSDRSILANIRSLGYQEAVCGLLKTGGRALGCFTINYKSKEQANQVDLFLFQNVVDQLSVAVANILATEEILEREREKATLLAISKAIASARHASELLAVIREKAQQLIPFYDTGILIVEPDELHHYDLAVRVPGWDISEVNQQLQAEGLDRVPHKDSYLAHVIQKIDEAMTPVIEDWEVAFEQFSHPFFPILKEGGYKQALVTTLKSGGKTIGTLWLNALEKNSFHPNQFDICQALADQISVALANILANEEILQGKREKDVLLKITQAIAAVNDKVTLLRTIFDLVQPVFQFDDLGLAILDPDKQHVTDWSAGTLGLSDSSVNAVLYAQQLARMDYPGTLLKYTIEQVEAQGQPLLVELTEELAIQWPDAVYLPIEIEHGQKECLFTTLKTGGQLLGSFNLNSKQAGYLATTDHTLFQAIADQIAVAVANILANEEILRREQEKSVLLSVSGDISSARDAVELLAIIREKAQQLIPFHDTGILIVEPDGQYHYDLAVTMPGWDPPVGNQKLIEDSLVRIPHPNSYVASVMELLQAEKSPVIEKFDCRYQEFDYPYFPYLKEMGYKVGLVGELKTGGRIYGTFWLNALEEEAFNPNQFSVFQSLTDLVAVAVANILANEEIREREQEKSMLLSISQQLSTIRNQEDLFNRFIHQLNNQLPFNEALVVLYDESIQTRRYLYNHLPPPKNTLSDYHYLLQKRLPVNGSPYEEIVTYKQPQIRTWLYWDARYPNDLGLRIARDNGLLEGLYMPLYYRSQLLGTFALYSGQLGRFTPAQLPLYSNLADQVAVAVANILANEEILKREQEKANLLAISTAIATIRDKDDLFRVISETVRPILGFDEAAQIFAIDPTDQTIGIFLRNTSRTISEDADYQQLTRQRFAIAGSPFEKILALPTVYLLDPIEEARQYPDYPGFPIMIRMGIRQSMIVPLRYAGRTIGTFHVFSTRDGFFGPVHFPFYETVANQIAVAVANILANEDILQREREKALQLAITNALSTEPTWESKLLAMVKTIQPHIPFDYVIAGLETNGEPKYSFSFYRTGADEYQIVSIEDFFRLSGLTAERFLPLRQQANHTRPLLLNGMELAQYIRRDELKRLICQTFRLQSHLLLPVPLTRDGHFILSFYCRHEDTYRPAHVALGQKLTQTLALTLDRLLAYEEVEVLSKQLKQENTYLQEEVRTNYRFEEIVGTSQAVRDVFQKVSKVGPMSSTVLILGETGTGKELVARAIHQASPRQAKPLIKINCAALPAQLIESELFGHEKGAFTGAIERRIGKFELAHESTIFLDEIGELPLELQAKLLRAIQEKEIERLGSNKVIQTDVRVLAATNRNLEKEVAEGRFRSDLYFRLNVYPIKLPPLRERKEDIPLLAIHFSQKLSKKLGKAINGFSNGAIKEMQAYHWPGNIRELEHVIERAAIESEGGTIRNLSLLKRPEGEVTVMINPTFQLKSYADGERELIMNTVRYCNGRIRGTGGAAQLLQVKATTLEARMKKLGIKREFFVNEGAGASATN